MDNEIRLWQWRYTDQSGRRRIYPSRLSEEDARHLKDAERVDPSKQVRRPPASAGVFQRSRLASKPRDASKAGSLMWISLAFVALMLFLSALALFIGEIADGLMEMLRWVFGAS